MEGAKDGFNVAIRIIPYLVAILVAVGMFRSSGALEAMITLIGPVTTLFGMPPEALPMALLRPLSGSGCLRYSRLYYSGSEYRAGLLCRIPCQHTSGFHRNNVLCSGGVFRGRADQANQICACRCLISGYSRDCRRRGYLFNFVRKSLKKERSQRLRQL